MVLTIILTAIPSLVLGYLVGNGRARSVKNDLTEFYEGLLADADQAHDRVYTELQEVKAKLSRKKTADENVKPA
jgi:hypothetical protein